MPIVAGWRVSGTTAPVRLALLFLLATVQSGCWEGTTRETLASVLSIEGSAEISSDGGRTFVPIAVGANASPRAVVRTSSASRVSLALLPNCLVRLEPNTRIEIVRVAVTKDGYETGGDMRGRFAEVKLIGGRCLFSHTWGEAIARFNVATAQGELVVISDALFWVETDAARTRVTCATGALDFRPKAAADATRITAGFMVDSSDARLDPSPADADQAGQEGIIEALRLEQNLRDLADGRRNILPR